MSYYAWDEDGCVDQVGSAMGWLRFMDWMDEQGGVIAEFSARCIAEGPEIDDLEAALRKATCDEPDLESIRLNLVEVASKAKGVLMISDGANGVTEDTYGATP
jgi:hypothetical protein